MGLFTSVMEHGSCDSSAWYLKFEKYVRDRHISTVYKATGVGFSSRSVNFRRRSTISWKNFKMSAVEQLRRQLDELMGTRRNGEDSRPEKLHYTSSRVCKNFLLNCCPYDILTSTRGDMGQCKKIHDVALRADYENSSKKNEYAFQKEALQHLKNFVSESERRIQFSKVRLAETQQILSSEESARAVLELILKMQQVFTKIRQIEEKINKEKILAEELGASNDVDGYLKLTEKIEALKEEKKIAEMLISKVEVVLRLRGLNVTSFLNSTPASISQQQKLRVCEVCNSYLGVYDNDKRLADHFNGKLHLGFITIREKLKELEVLVEYHHIKAIVSSEFNSENICNKRSRSVSPNNSKYHHKHRSRSRSKERRHKHKSSKRDSHSSHHKRRRHSKDYENASRSSK
ncbi:putative RNA-binding protein Luc7-like 1 [Caerostris extrusa]|uniref:RNA-binding protein Luc7-like 1 n=1 Tax=Caerostris extrusa TaxID=172846 RepID=A0AAV4WDD3_CAEEX|nr:putative RNA-binding protein Luc7-like 1 [Caerostris extrusa]